MEGRLSKCNSGAHKINLLLGARHLLGLVFCTHRGVRGQAQYTSLSLSDRHLFKWVCAPCDWEIKIRCDARYCFLSVLPAAVTCMELWHRRKSRASNIHHLPQWKVPKFRFQWITGDRKLGNCITWQAKHNGKPETLTGLQFPMKDKMFCNS